MFESKAGVLWIGGIAFFILAFVSNALLPMFMFRNLDEDSVEVLVGGGGEMQKDGKTPRKFNVKKNTNLMFQFTDLARRYPESFKKYYGEPTEEACAKALRLGRQLYIGEGCWHCHSQFVRPVSNESRRWGEVSETEEYQNELQRPVMFGTRRVGPDLCREGGRHANDWHTIHFFNPSTIAETSPMPQYPWFFDGSPDKPNNRGIAIITYIQWLGSWLPSYPYYEELKESMAE